MVANFQNRKADCGVGPAQYQLECSQYVCLWDGMLTHFQNRRAGYCGPSPVSAGMLTFCLITGRNAIEISKSRGGLGWTQPSIILNANVFKIISRRNARFQNHKADCGGDPAQYQPEW